MSVKRSAIILTTAAWTTLVSAGQPVVRTDPIPAEPKIVRAERDPDLGPHAPAAADVAWPEPSAAAFTSRRTPHRARAEGAEWDELIQRTSALEAIEPGTRTRATWRTSRADELEALEIPKVEASKLAGVQPGETTWTEAVEKFGEPRESSVTDGAGVAKFNFPPFEGAETTVVDGVVVSIAIIPGKPLDADAAAKQLGLDEIRSVLVRDKNGAKLGIAFPEKGVLFCYNVEATGITQVILEPIDAEAFVLRAEANLSTAPRAAYIDLESALFDDPKHAGALRLKAKLLGEMGHWTDAFATLKQAFQAGPSDTQTRLLSAELLIRTGGYIEAKKTLQTMLAETRLTPETRARAECLLGDVLATGPQRDDAAALKHHTAALKAAEALLNDPNPIKRRAAKRVTLDANLGVANDIGWGFFQQKNVAVPRWVDKAKDAALDLINNEEGNPELEFLVARRALAAYAGTQGQLDPAPWTKTALRAHKMLTEKNDDPWRSRRLSWELGLAMYDSLQCDQARGIEGHVLANSTLVVKHLEEGAAHREQTDIDAFMLGRLYYRIGAIFAIKKNDHAKATLWYAKALPLIEEPLPDATPGDLARHGETLVSMGLSFFEVGKETRGVELTKAGIDLMQVAVKAKALPENSLAVPYSNLAAMLKHVGNTDESRSFEALANRAGGGVKR